MDYAALRYWVGFNHVQGFGSVRVHALYEHFGDLERAWHADEHELDPVVNNRIALQNLLNARQKIDLDAILDQQLKQGIGVLTPLHAEYPPALRTIKYPPCVLYVKGTLLPKDELAVSIVGSRDASVYGAYAARWFGYELSRANVTVISGLAQGIDTAAHQAAVSVHGRTIAVLGHGLDTVYPAGNRGLAEQITQNGALISEYGLGMRPEATNFPMRNRLVSGLAKLILVVEAGLKSGTLNMVTHAQEQGRPIYAVPGGVYHPQSIGTNFLIRTQQANMATHPQDLLTVLNLPILEPLIQPQMGDSPRKSKSTRNKSETPATPPKADPIPFSSPPLSEEELAILKQFADTPLTITQICTATALSAAEVTSTLTLLELSGYIKQFGPDRYILRNS
jgi:DNA processing protein